VIRMRVRTSQLLGIQGRQPKPKRKKAVKKFEKRLKYRRRRRPQPPKRPAFVTIHTPLGEVVTPTDALNYKPRFQP